jgi:thiol-disulfide isomerase/thioredoxin
MKAFRLQTAATLLFVIFTASSASASPGPEDRWLYGATGYARALEMQRELNVPLIVYFYTDWCPYCHELDNQYLSAAPVRQYLRTVVKVRINPENGSAEREIAKQYGVRGYPSFFVMRNLTSQPVDVQPFGRKGNLSPAEFVSACEQAASFSTATKIRTPTASGNTGGSSVGRNSTQTTTGSTQQKAQVVVVPPSGPTFINNGPLPTLDAVLAKYVAALGGRDAQRRITSRVSKGRVDIPGVSFGGKVEVYAKAPNKSLTVMNAEPVGLIKEAFDGRTGWSLTPNGLDTVVDRNAFIDADFYWETKLTELYTRIKLLGKVKEGFRHVYLVEAVPKGGAAENLYFDVETGLLVRRDVTRRTPTGPVRAEVYFSDWREVDGVKLPFRITQAMPKTKILITFEDIKQNVPVDDAMFRRPQQ